MQRISFYSDFFVVIYFVKTVLTLNDSYIHNTILLYDVYKYIYTVYIMDIKSFRVKAALCSRRFREIVCKRARSRYTYLFLCAQRGSFE